MTHRLTPRARIRRHARCNPLLPPETNETRHVAIPVTVIVV